MDGIILDLCEIQKGTCSSFYKNISFSFHFLQNSFTHWKYIYKKALCKTNLIYIFTPNGGSISGSNVRGKGNIAFNSQSVVLMLLILQLKFTLPHGRSTATDPKITIIRVNCFPLFFSTSRRNIVTNVNQKCSKFENKCIYNIKKYTLSIFRG